jgi:hypothetical protein
MLLNEIEVIEIMDELLLMLKEYLMDVDLDLLMEQLLVDV